MYKTLAYILIAMCVVALFGLISHDEFVVIQAAKGNHVESLPTWAIILVGLGCLAGMLCGALAIREDNSRIDDQIVKNGLRYDPPRRKR